MSREERPRRGRERRRELVWSRPEPGARRSRFTRDQIAAAALHVADEEGLEAVSMRRIAAELGAGTMTLYHYVQTKDELLALMDDAWMAELLVDDRELEGDWRAALIAIARASRRAGQLHPWVVNHPIRAQFGPNAMRHFDQSLRAVASLRLAPADRMQLIGILDDYVFGYVVRELQDPPNDADWGESIREVIEDYLASGDFPTIQALVDDAGGDWRRLLAELEDEDRFEVGLGALLDGIEADLRRRGVI